MNRFLNQKFSQNISLLNGVHYNFGHGNKHLCSVMGLLMMLAFLIDQVQLLGCRLYQAARKKATTFRNLWEKIRVFFDSFEMSSWEELLSIIAKKLFLDSS